MGQLLVNILSAFRSLREQWQRAVLSALGITVGSMAIVLLISIARGVQEDIQGQVDNLGVNLLIVVPFHVPDDGSLSFNPNVAGLSYLRESDVAEVKKVKGIREAVPWVFPGGTLKNGKTESSSTLIIATEPGWFEIRPFKLREGRVFTQSENAQRVCVIGEMPKLILFGPGPAVGKSVTINGEQYRIVGVTEKEKDDSLLSFASLENVAFIPYRYVATKLKAPALSRIIIQTESTVEPKTLVANVERVLMKRLARENFSVITQKDLLKLLFSVMGILTSLLFGLTSIALFVGGVGIMTVMLMSVNERAKEIGVRKTVGATRSAIFVQFLCEAIVLALAGGIVGLVLSYLVCLGLYNFTQIKPLITIQTVALSFAVSLGVGAVFGVLPAMRAARQDPVLSLRHE